MSDRENRRTRERWELGCAGGLEARLHCAERWGAERPVCIAQLSSSWGLGGWGCKVSCSGKSLPLVWRLAPS